MPALPSPGKVIQETYHWAIGSDLTAIVRRFYSYTGAVSAADATTLATTVNAAQVSYLRALTCTATTYLGNTITDLSSSTGVQITVGASSAGTRAGSGLPGSASAVEQLHIARRYRGGKPRSYWPFGTGNDTFSAQLWLAASVTAFTNALQTFQSAAYSTPPAGIGTMNPVNVSFYSGFTNVTRPSGRQSSRPNPRPTPIVDPVLSGSFRQTIGSQRRRLKPAS